MQGLPAEKLPPTFFRNQYLSFLDVQNSSSSLEGEQDFRVLRKGLCSEGMQGSLYPSQPRFMTSDLTSESPSSVRREKSIPIANQESLSIIAGRNVLRKTDRSMVRQLELCEYFLLHHLLKLYVPYSQPFWQTWNCRACSRRSSIL